MTERQLGRVVITGLALWLVVRAVDQSAFLAFSYWVSPVPAGILVAYFSYLVILAGGGLLLLLPREWLAARLFREDAAGLASHGGELVAALVAVIGVVFVAYAAARLLGLEANYWLARRHAATLLPGEAVHVFTEGETPQEAGVRAAAIFCVGASLFLGSRGLAGLWERLRSAGRREA